MLRLMAALALASVIAPAAVAANSAGLSTAAWWERVTVTLAGDGKTQSCRYETSAGRPGRSNAKWSEPKLLTAAENRGAR